MKRPYIICHMVTGIDGKVTGEFLRSSACQRACEIYYEINRSTPADGFICGRVTMEQSFTAGWYPDLSRYEPVPHRADHLPDKMSGFYAVAFDSHGRLGWQSNRIVDPDGDPGYDGAQIIEVLSEQVDERYLGYLQAMHIPYLFAGKERVDVKLALFKLRSLVGCQRLLLEGGSILNGAFERAGAVDEVSLVVAPLAAHKDDGPLFADSDGTAFELVTAQTQDGVVVLRYKRRSAQ